MRLYDKVVKSFFAYLKQKKVLFKMISSSYLALPVNLIVAVFTYRLIDPYFMGIWATMIVFETYANALRLGIVNGMNRELPYAMGSGKEKEALTYAQTTLAYNLITVIPLWIIIPFIIFKFELNQTYSNSRR